MTATAAPVHENLHASTMVLGESGILVRGPSGSGKTRLVLTLVERGMRDGRFARLVADDRSLVTAHGSRLVARPHPRLAGLVERRGLGLLPIAHEPACLLGLLVDLTCDPVPRLPEPDARSVTIAGVALPRLALSAALPAEDAVSLVFAMSATLELPAQALAPFSLPSPSRCTR